VPLGLVSTLVRAWSCVAALGEPVGVQPVKPFVTFPVHVTIAGEDANDERLGAAFETAAAFFGPLGVAFRRAREGEGRLPERFAHVETRKDRDDLAAHVVPHAINVFVVDSLRDVDDPAEMRRGVHWHGPGGTHYVVLVATASSQVLAHELGHFFGNAHSKVPDNLMSYEREGGWVFFDAAQGRRIVARARGYLESGELPAL
jgi:hypothetical protein